MGTVYGAEAGDGIGGALVSGDINGDGAVDMVIALAQSGDIEVDILWGQHMGVVDLAVLEVGITRILGAPGDDATNSRLACADFDADGYDDIALGLPLRGSGVGRAYIVFGCSSLADTIALASPTERVTAIDGVWYEGSALGWDVTGGDVNGDLFDDLIVSAPNFDWSGGEIYIIYGRGTFPAFMDVATALPGMTRVIEPEMYRGAGRSLACRDVNGDGHADVLIGEPGNLPEHPSDIGMATLLYGAYDFPDTLLLSDATFGTKKFYGVSRNDWLGYSVAISDLNADQYPEIILSAIGSDPFNCGACGQVYAVWGGQALPDSTYMGDTSVLMTRLLGAGDDTRFGVSLAVGDVNGDGREDVAIGSKPDYYDQTDVGKLTVVEGRWELPDTVFLASDSSLTRVEGGSHEDRFGRSVSLADYSGDGNADLVVSAMRSSPLGRTYAGEVFLYLGADTVVAMLLRPWRAVRLVQNYPNPFNPSTTIVYAIDAELAVRLRVFDVRGALVATLVDATQSAGIHEIIWDGVSDTGKVVPSGVYFYRIEAGHQSVARKLVVVK